MEQFNEYSKLFYDLTKRNFIDTQFDVISVIITYDSQNCVAMVKESDEKYEI